MPPPRAVKGGSKPAAKASLSAIVLHVADNVATLMDDGAVGQDCRLFGAQSGQIRLMQAIDYGHKVSLRQLEKGDPVVKYGEIVGRATVHIPVGMHVHVHNVESRRGRGDLITVDGTGAV